MQKETQQQTLGQTTPAPVSDLSPEMSNIASSPPHLVPAASTSSVPLVTGAAASPSAASLPDDLRRASLSEGVVAESAPPAGSVAAPSTAVSSTLRGVPPGLKVLVNFRATGSAPIMKKTKFTLNASHRFGMIIDWLRRTLHFKPQDALFVFCNAAFSPNPDSIMYDLYQCFSVQGELVINYAIQDAWG